MKKPTLATRLTLLVFGATVATSSFAANLYPVLVEDNWGFMDKSGTTVIKPQFDRAEPFVNDLAAVRLKRWGYVDTSGTIVINPQFDEAGPFREGLAVFKIGGLFGYVNPAGK